jgi:predicted Zn-dependent protease
MFPSMDIYVYGSEDWSPSGDYSSADWYVDHTNMVMGLEGRWQLDADHLASLMVGEPWQANPHIDVMITSWDLTAFDGGQQMNFVFGEARGRVTVQSLARFRGLLRTDRYLAVKGVIHHELGHIYGMAANLGRSNTVYSIGPHCTNPGCIMQQGLSVGEWVAHAKESYSRGQIYCPQCMADVVVPVH